MSTKCFFKFLLTAQIALWIGSSFLYGISSGVTIQVKCGLACNCYDDPNANPQVNYQSCEVSRQIPIHQNQPEPTCTSVKTDTSIDVLGRCECCKAPQMCTAPNNGICQ